ncbi:DUF5675 family protein [uncultured Bacteroides sp.]|uniref:DUF5675 family protein n=1 Tax=uncultured Bacteroides sp. TaxID=162156 RepID=UPI002AA8DDE1|nr:DUF5675 family protein [uncultured Bacteroides sp.]
MELKLERIYLNKDYTIGKLYIDNEYYCDTLEDTTRDINKDGKFDNGETKIYGSTAIPFGKYLVDVTYSNHFKKLLPLLIDVPAFDGVRIHAGNVTADTLGCILVGLNKIKGQLVNSRIYANLLTDKLTQAKSNNERIYISIV